MQIGGGSLFIEIGEFEHHAVWEEEKMVERGPRV